MSCFLRLMAGGRLTDALLLTQIRASWGPGAADKKPVQAEAAAAEACSCSSSGGTERAAARMEHIRATLPEGFTPDSVLDVGCADGTSS